MEMNKELSKAAEAKMETAETLDEVVRIFAEEGVEVSKDELIAALDAPEGELGEGDLDQVAGGCGPIWWGGVLIPLWLWWKLRNKRR